jgi:MFS family permease
MFTYLGMSFGSVGWGVISDAFGRRFTFNSTLLLTGVFGVLISFGPTYAITTFLFACMGVGVGGNLPVDGALFLEFLPMADNRLLTLLSAWWPGGQLVSAIGLSSSWYGRLVPNDTASGMVFHSPLLLRGEHPALLRIRRPAAMLRPEQQQRLEVFHSCSWAFHSGYVCLPLRLI